MPESLTPYPYAPLPHPLTERRILTMPQTILSAAAADGQLKLLKTGAFSDFKVICKNHKFKVHRAILCPASTYFSKICPNGFGFIEGAEGAVDMSEDDPTIVSRVLLYQYTKGYDAGAVPDIGNQKAVRQGEKIDITDEQENGSAAATTIKGVAPKSYRTKNGLEITIDQAKEHLSVHAEVYTCADRLGIEELKEYACSQFVDVAGDEEMKLYHEEFYGKLLTFIYENTVVETTQRQEQGSERTFRTTSGLRCAATMCAVSNMSLIVVVATIRDAIKEHEPISWEVALLLREKRELLEQAMDSLRTANKIVRNHGAGKVAYAKDVVGQLTNYLRNARRCANCNKELKIGRLSVEGGNLQDNVKVVVNCRGCRERLAIEIR